MNNYLRRLLSSNLTTNEIKISLAVALSDEGLSQYDMVKDFSWKKSSCSECTNKLVESKIIEGNKFHTTVVYSPVNGCNWNDIKTKTFINEITRSNMITGNGYRILLCLLIDGAGKSQVEIVNSYGYKRSTVSRIINNLLIMGVLIPNNAHGAIVYNLNYEWKHKKEI